jgi:hypothetical protein
MLMMYKRGKFGENYYASLELCDKFILPMKKPFKKDYRRKWKKI